MAVSARRVEAFVAMHPGLTMREVAAGVEARAADVADALRESLLLVRVASGSRMEWFVRQEGGERREQPVSQAGLLLALLSDGEWWSCRELLRRVPCIVHSRIAGLRDAGHVIVHERRGPGAGGSFYRLDLGGETTGAKPAGGDAHPARDLPVSAGVSQISLLPESRPSRRFDDRDAA